MLGAEILKNIFAAITLHCAALLLYLLCVCVVIAIINQHGGIVLGAGIINYPMINCTAKSSFFNKIYDAIVKNRINNFNGFPTDNVWPQKKSIKTSLIRRAVLFILHMRAAPVCVCIMVCQSSMTPPNIN